jgi:uncharacterized membrane protein YjgN (DUF898 family)
MARTQGARTQGQFTFDGSVGGYVATWLAAAAISVVTLGFGLPISLVHAQRWKAAHTSVGGRHLEFSGRAGDLARDWLRWWPLVLVTLGLYGLAVVPKLRRWVWANTGYALPRGDWCLDGEHTSYAARHLAAPPSGLHLAFFTEPAREHAHA